MKLDARARLVRGEQLVYLLDVSLRLAGSRRQHATLRIRDPDPTYALDGHDAVLMAALEPFEPLQLGAEGATHRRPIEMRTQ